MSWQAGDPVRIEVGALLLRSFRSSDVAGAYLRWVADAELAKVVSLPQGASEAQQRRVLELADDRTRFMLAILQGSIEQLIGFVRINVEPLSQRGHVTLVIGEARHRGQGVAQRLWPALHAFLFDAMGLHKVSYDVRAGNEAAIHLLRKSGAVEEVRHREHERLPDGQFVDVLAFGCLQSEWLARQGSPT